jgi:hypothetical protein
MDIGAQLVTLAQEYIADRTELAAVDTWLAQHAQELTGAAEPAASLAGLIEVTLAEMDAGHATEVELRSRMEGFLAGLNARPSAGRIAS